EWPRHASEGGSLDGAALAQLRSSNQEAMRTRGANGVAPDRFRILPQEFRGALRGRDEMQNARLGEIPPRHADGGQTVHQVERFADSSLRKGRGETQTRDELADGANPGGRAR